MTTPLDSLLSELDHISDMVSNRDGRSLSDVQLSIMMKNRIFSLKTVTNEANIDTTIDPEVKIKTYIEAIRRLKKIFTYEPAEHSLLFWYQLHNFHQMLVGGVVQYNGKAGKLGLVGLAHALSDLLLGLDLPNFHTLLEDDRAPDFYQRFMLAYNMASAQSAVYGTVLLLLPYVRVEDAIRYTHKIIEAFEILVDIIDKYWKPGQVLESKVSIATLEQKLQSAVIVSMAPSNIAIGHYNIFPRFRKAPSEGIVPNKIFGDITPEAMFESTLKLFDKSDKLLEEVISLVKSSSTYSNVDIESNPVLQIFTTQVRHARQITETMKALHAYRTAGDWQGFHERAEASLRMLESQKQLLNSRQFMESSLGEAMDSYLAYYIPLITVYAQSKEPLNTMERLREALGLYLRDEGMVYFPKSKLNYLISRITVLLEHDPEQFVIEVEDIEEQLSKLIQNLQLFPKEMMTAETLLLFTKLIGGKDVEDNLEEMKELRDELTKNGGSHNFDFIPYVDYLSAALAGEDVKFSKDIQEKEWLFDAYSYIVPDFSMLLKERGLQNLVYYPFNLWQDAILWENEQEQRQ